MSEPRSSVTGITAGYSLVLHRRQVDQSDLCLLGNPTDSKGGKVGGGEGIISMKICRGFQTERGFQTYRLSSGSVWAWWTYITV